jgi:conjugal transfer pilus assembly protein TraW
MKILMFCMFLIITSQQDALSKDFGVVGHVWDIAEEDILEYIEKKLRSVDVDKLKEEMRGKTREAVERPKQVNGVKTALLQRIHYYDPSYVVPEDIYDHKGNLLYKAGYKVNPLNKVPLRERLIFINGDNGEQVKYALKKRKEYQGLAKIILTKGAPLEVQRKEKVWMYFDQQGVLTTNLGIKAVPALVEQSGLRLKVTEVSKEEWGEK